MAEGQGRGWVTAEYGMLPPGDAGAHPREAAAGKQNGRTVEIQRLIGRFVARHRRPPGAGRAPDHRGLRRDPGRCAPAPPRSPAPGRARRLHRLDEGAQHAQGNVLRDNVAAISCGIYGGTPVLDLDYAEIRRPIPTPISS